MVGSGSSEVGKQHLEQKERETGEQTGGRYTVEDQNREDKAWEAG